MAGVRHEVDLGEAGPGHAPVIDLQVDVALEQCPRVDPAIAAGWSWRLVGPRRRSIWRGLIRRSCWHTVADRPSRQRGQGSHHGRNAFSRSD